MSTVEWTQPKYVALAWWCPNRKGLFIQVKGVSVPKPSTATGQKRRTRKPTAYDKSFFRRGHKMWHGTPSYEQLSEKVGQPLEDLSIAATLRAGHPTLHSFMRHLNNTDEAWAFDPPGEEKEAEPRAPNFFDHLKWD